MGDVIQAMPVLRVLKRKLPDAQVFWWIETSLAPLLEGDPDLAGLFIFNRKGWRRPGWWQQIWRTIRTVRSHRFDYVFDLQGLSRSAFFSWLANGKTTVGLDNDREGNREGAQIFYDVLAPRSPPGTPAAERYLNALRVLPLEVSWDFEWLPEATAAAAKVREEMKKITDARHTGPLPDAKGSDTKWIVLLPGARWLNKRWPADYFAETVNRLSGAYPHCQFAILGAAGDAPLAETISRSNPGRCVDLTGRTSLREMIEWLRQADLVISNDTGPLHAAAALKRPVLAIYGPSDPLYTGPHNQSAGVLQAKHLPCVPCMKQTCAYHEPLACLHAITPEQVSARAIAILNI